MIAAISVLRGYKISDEQVRTLAFICLTRSKPAADAEAIRIFIWNETLRRLVMQISGETLVKVNHAVGFRLATKAGSSRLINLTKLVPVVGGVVRAAFDATLTYGIGAIAKKAFNAFESPSLQPSTSLLPRPRSYGGSI